MEDVLNKIYEYLATYGLQVLAAIVIFIIGKWIARILSNITKKVMTKSNVDATLVKFVGNFVYAILLVFVVLAAIGKLGVQTTSFIAVIGAAGLAVGMALQGSLANFAAGVLLIIFRPFKAGDFISAGGEMGTVQEIQIFVTTLSTPDNRKVIIPNNQVTSGSITNFSAIDKRRVDMVFGISYGDDMKKAKEILMGLCKADSRILSDPEPVVAVSELGDSSVNLVCRPWVKPADYWSVLFDLTENGKVELEKNGLSIPFPQRDVHLFQTSQGA